MIVKMEREKEEVRQVKPILISKYRRVN